MSIQYEIVTVTVGGSNPQTIPVSVPVDTTTGAGTATFQYTGTNGGTDTLTANGTMAGTGYVSNTAEVNWQTTNGRIQVGNVVTCAAWNDSPTSGMVADYVWCNSGDTAGIASGCSIRSITPPSSTQTNNSLCFDAFPDGTSGYGTDGIPPRWSTLTSLGTVASNLSFPPYTRDFNCCVTGYILVPVAGSYTLSLTANSNTMWGLGPSTTGAEATWSGKGSIVLNNQLHGSKAPTMTALNGYPLLNPVRSNITTLSTTLVTFSQAGVYPIEVDWDWWYHSGRVCHVQVNSSELSPVVLISAPPVTTPSGNLTITANNNTPPTAGGFSSLQFTGSPITLNVNVSGITYSSKSYCPVLEGSSGSLILYNDASSNVYTLQTYNGQAVDKAAYAPVGFQLSSSDNTAYSGLFSVGYGGTDLSLNYNGGTANPNGSSRVLSTSLIITADDIAWYNGVNKSFDLFTPTGSVGGNTFNFEVDYMNKPTVASISPTTITAVGGSNLLVISLNKAFSPQQQGGYGTGNTINCSCLVSGATSTGSPSPNIDSAGWLTGWNVPFIAPSSITNQTLTVHLTVSGLLTYLSGNTFVTNTVTYIDGNVGTITATGSTYAPPVAQSLSVSPSSTAMGTSATLVGTVFTAGTNDSVTCVFYYQPVGGSTQYPLGTGTQTSSVPATVGSVTGYLQTFTLTFSPSGYINSTGAYLAFTATDNVSSQTCSYTTTSVYTYSTGVSIGISPSNISISQYGSGTFYATVTGSSATPTWTISSSPSGAFSLSSSSGSNVTVTNHGSYGGGNLLASVAGATASASFECIP